MSNLKEIFFYSQWLICVSAMIYVVIVVTPRKKTPKPRHGGKKKIDPIKASHSRFEG